MTSLGNLKRGDTLAFYITLPGAGSPTNIRCQVRDYDGGLPIAVQVSTTETSDKYLFRVSDTSAFPLGVVVFDVVNAGTNKTTETVSITVVERVTDIA